MRLLTYIHDHEMGIAVTLMALCLVLGAGIGLDLSSRRAFPDREYVIATDHSPPFQIVNPDGTVTGAMAEAIERAATRLNVRLKWRAVRGGPDVHLGVDPSVDLWPFVMYLPEREGRFHLAQAFVTAGYVLVSSSNLEHAPRTAMAGKRVAFRDIPHFRNLFRGSFPDSTPVPIREVDDVLLAACRGEVDGAVTEPNQLQDFLMRNRDRCAGGRLYTTGIADWRVKLSIASTNECAALADALRAELGAMARERAMDDLFTRFQPLSSLRGAETFLETDTERKIGMSLWLLLALGFACLLLVLRVIRLRQKTARALRLADDRSRYLADMSHELRTPLNGILGMANLLKDANLSAAQRDHLNVIEQSGNELLSMINNVLDLAKLERQGVASELEKVAPRVLADTLLRIFTPVLHSRNIECVLDVDPAVPESAVLDAAKFRQVFVNLVGNAVKFTEEGFVHIRLTLVQFPSGDRHLRTEVIDSGPGIAESEQLQLFQEFGQTGAGKKSLVKGSGLGLQIAKRLTFFAGGRLGVVSTPGEGSTFWFEIPIENWTQADTEPISAEDQEAERFVAGKHFLIVGAKERLQRALSADLRRKHAELRFAGSLDPEWMDGLTRVDVLLLDAPYLLSGSPDVVDRIRSLRSRFHAVEVFVMCDGSAQASRVQALGLRWLRSILKPVRLAELARIPDGDIRRSNNLVSLAKAVATPERQAPGQTEYFPHEPPDLAPLRILVGEDNPVNRLVIQAIIERLGHDGTIIPDGARLVAELRKGETFDLILMDCNMPGLDGFEASRHIRELYPDRDRLPIVAVTANAPEDVYDKCMASGMNDVVGKPVTADLLRGVIARYARAGHSR